MLDPAFVRDRLDEVSAGLRRRGLDPDAELKAFLDLDAPVSRLTMPDIPSPHNPKLLDWAVPSVERIRARIDLMVSF